MLVNIVTAQIKRSSYEKLSGHNIDSKLNFKNIATKRSCKKHTIFILPQFTYRPLTWMFHNRVLNFFIWRIIEKDNLPSNTPQKYASAGHIYVQSLQWNTSKHYDRGLPTKLTLMTPTWLIKKWYPWRL